MRETMIADGDTELANVVVVVGVVGFAVTQLTSGLVGHWSNVSCRKPIDDGGT